MKRQNLDIMENTAMCLTILPEKPIVYMDFLKQNIEDWITIMTQKDAGQREKKDSVTWDNMERIRMNILCGGLSLAFSGKLNDMVQVQEDTEYSSYTKIDFSDKDYSPSKAYLQAGAHEGNPQGLKQLCADWYYMTYGKQDKRLGIEGHHYHTDGFDDLEALKIAILCEMVALYLSGQLEEDKRLRTIDFSGVDKRYKVIDFPEREPFDPMSEHKTEEQYYYELRELKEMRDGSVIRVVDKENGIDELFQSLSHEYNWYYKSVIWQSIENGYILTCSEVADKQWMRNRQ